MKIAFSGAQSTGKTTIIDELKKLPEFCNCTFKTNMTRSIEKKGFFINERGNSETQSRIIREHVDRLNTKGDVFLDRCILDGVVYTHYLFEKNQVDYDTMKHAIKSFEKYIDYYTRIFYFEPDLPLVNDNVRSIDSTFRDKIVKLFEYYITIYSIPVIRVSGIGEQRIQKVIEVLKGDGYE